MKSLSQAVIWFLGDAHGEFEHIYRAIDTATVRPAAVVFLGDIESPTLFDEVIERIESYGTVAYWIIGNHPTDSESNYRHLQTPLAQARCIDGRVVEIAGQRKWYYAITRITAHSIASR